MGSKKDPLNWTDQIYSSLSYPNYGLTTTNSTSGLFYNPTSWKVQQSWEKPQALWESVPPAKPKKKKAQGPLEWLHAEVDKVVELGYLHD